MKVQRAIVVTLMCWRGCDTLKFYVIVFLCDGQGIVRRGIHYGDRSCMMLSASEVASSLVLLFLGTVGR